MTQTVSPFTKVPGSTLGGLAGGVAATAIPGLFPRTVAQALPPGINAGAAITGIAQAARNPMGLMGLAGQAVHGILAGNAQRRLAASRGAIPGAQLLFVPGDSPFNAAHPRYRALAVLGATVTAANGEQLAVDIPYQAQVTVRERHRDELEITRHPVEFGASITDHAFKRPAEVIIQCGWSNSPSPSVAGKVASATEPSALIPWRKGGDFISNVYEALLKLQASRDPFVVYTGKRVYQNMLFASLDVETDETTENALMVTARLQEIIIAQVTVTEIPRNAVQGKLGGGTGPASGTSTVANTGVQAPTIDTSTISNGAACKAVGSVFDLVNEVTPVTNAAPIVGP